MPRRRKDEAKREAARALRSLDGALLHVYNLYRIFNAHHPEYAETFEIIGKQLLLVQEEIKDVWQSAWGDLPESLDGYAL